MSVENQKIIIVQKETADVKHPYSIINLEALNKALSVLKTTDLKLWLFIAKNQNGYKFELSKAKFCQDCSVSKPTYLKAVQSLIEKGYLVLKNKKTNTYTFFEGGGQGKDSVDITVEYPKEKIQSFKEFKF